MVWEKSLAPGEKMPLAIVYDSSVYDFQEHKVFHFKFSPIVAIIVLICIFLPLLFTVVLLGTYSRFFGYRSDDRYLHRRHHFDGGGFGGGFGGGGGCACACACACAGGGRAGCSSKDFYGTKLESARVRARLKAQLKK